MITYTGDVMTVLFLSVFFCLIFQMPMCAVESLLWKKQGKPKCQTTEATEAPQLLVVDDKKLEGIDNPTFTPTAEDERL